MKRLELAEEKTSAEHGKRVEARNLAERMECGIILLDKASGPTSHQLTAWIRGMFELEKMGHGGTLDPFATGLLPLLLGKSMRLTGPLLTHDKTYVAVMRIHGGVEQERLVQVLKRQKGGIYNVPPEISAVKVQVRTRRISRLELLAFDDEHFVVEIDCEAGTYVRTMARDIGLFIGRRVELVELRRTRSGMFSLEHCVNVEQLADAWWLYSERGEEEALKRIIQPMELLVDRYPSVVVKDGAAASISHGAPLLRPGIISMPTDCNAGTEVALHTVKGELVALAELLHDSEQIAPLENGEMARSTTVLMKPGVYPRHRN